MSTGSSRRPYDSSRRREQAERTRATVLEAARARFLADGYAGTTVAAVARDAGVSVETVYKGFGTKAGLAKAVHDRAVVGDGADVPMLQSEFVRRNLVEPDPVAKVQAYGHQVATVGGRTGPMLLVVRDAAAADVGAAEVWDEVQAERLRGMAAFAGHLSEAGHLRDDVGVDEARDVLWLHSSVEVWELLVIRRGWDPGRFGTWLGGQLVAALLAGPAIRS